MGTIVLMILAFVAGMVVDNRFAPKVKRVDGKITLEWSDKKKNKPNTP